MDKERYKQLIHEGRMFMHNMHGDETDEEWTSDQLKKLPQPPLVKEQMTEETIALNRDFSTVIQEQDFFTVLKARKSNRVYTDGTMTIDQLSFLLWAIQGVKDIRGKNYATLRTVPSGGARHPFETYLFVRNIEGLKQGLYHYLPMSHRLEFLKDVENIEEVMNKAVCEQAWVKKANVLFVFTCVPYRAEWRYSYDAHRTALIDLGHVGENLYLSAASLNLGTCGIAAFNDFFANGFLGLDGNEEFVCYTQPVGTVQAEDKAKEDAFYSFLDEE